MEKLIKYNTSERSMSSRLEKIVYNSVLLTTLLSPPVLAQEAQEERRSSLCGTVEQCTQQGSEEYKKGSLGNAINIFKEALTMDPVPEYRAALHLNLAACYKDLGEPGLAIDQLLRYLRERPDNSDLPDRNKIDQSLSGLHLYEQGLELREEERRREIKPGEKRDFNPAIGLLEKAYAAASARSSLGALLRDLGVTYELAGNYKLAAENYEGYLRELGPRARDRDMLWKRIKSLREREKEIELPLIPPVSLSTPAPSFWEAHKLSTIIAGGAAALGIGALANHLGANAAYADLRERCEGKDTCSPADAEGIRSRDTLTAVLGISSALALGAAGALFYFELPEYVPTAAANGVQWKVKF